MPRDVAATSECPPDAAFVDLLDGRLASPDADRLKRHVAQCGACRALLDELTGVSATDVGPRAPTATDDRIAREILRGGGASGGASAAGRTIDRKYALVRLLGKGGMGEVYEAEHLGTGRRVAVKLIHGQQRERGVEAEGRFRREARAVGAAPSPHVVEVLDAGEDAATGDLYLVMEHLTGEDLQHLLDRVGPLPPDVALRVAAQALLGLVKAHEAGVVHRDIKPANLFLARGGDAGLVTVKLLDFGIAKVTREPLRAALTRTDGLLGSPLYMSPEQMANSRNVDGRTDLWSLGSTLYCALAGSAPFGHVENVFELLPAIRSGGAPRLRDRAPWVPSETAEAVHRALAVDPDERYASAADMLDALRPLLPDGVALREEALIGVSPEARRVVLAAPSPRAGSSARARIAALAVVLLGVGVAARYATSPAPVPVASASPAPAAPAPPPASSAAPMATPDPIRRVTLLIAPEDASVEVDGIRADARGGAVEIAGLLGSVHHVRISKGKDELPAEVVVTEQGAVPPRVELVPPRFVGVARKPAATASARPSPGDPMREHQ